MILVLSAVDDRYLSLPEGVVERIVDGVDRQPQANRRVSIDRNVGLEGALLLIQIDVPEDIAVRQRLRQLRRPFIEFRRVVGEQGVLVGRVALPATGPQIGAGEHK
jgi:hypothetical protein